MMSEFTFKMNRKNLTLLVAWLDYQNCPEVGKALEVIAGLPEVYGEVVDFTHTIYPHTVIWEHGNKTVEEEGDNIVTLFTLYEKGEDFFQLLEEVVKKLDGEIVK